VTAGPPCAAVGGVPVIGYRRPVGEQRVMSDKFQPYLDSVIKSGERTRNVWYLLVLVLLATFFSEWNTRDQNSSTVRFMEMMNALVCISDTKHVLNSAAVAPPLSDLSCEDGLKYAQLRHHFTKAFALIPSEVQLTVKQILQKRVEDFMRRELEAHVITVPILGITIDGNDLWIISTIIMIFLLRVLLASLEREMDNIGRAAKQASDPTEKELIVMSQLFASRLNHYHPLTILLFSPVFLNLYNLFVEYQGWETGALLRGGIDWNEITFFFQMAFTTWLGWLCFSCFQAAKGIEKLIFNLEDEAKSGANNQNEFATPVASLGSAAE
jgi:hypothetical protein